MRKFDIIVPAAGESVTEGDIARWFKEDGDIVEMDEALLELETDKASLEISSPCDGKLKILVEEGTTVPVGQIVGQVDSSDFTAPEPDAEDPATAQQVATEHLELDKDDSKTSSKKDVEMPSPAARKLMTENQVSAQDVTGTGKGGRITKADALRFVTERKAMEATADVEPNGRAVASQRATEPITPPSMEKTAPMARAPTAPGPVAPPAPPAPGERPTRVEHMSRLRRTIAERMVSANQSMALLTTFNEFDMSAVIALRKQYKESFKEKHDVNLGFMSFFLKAATQALQEYPVVNAMVDADEIVYHDYCDICIAVATPKGLVAPVVRDTQNLSFAKIEKTVFDLAMRGRTSDLSIGDLTGGTFTITNGGVFGSMLSTPIVNPPQSAILGMHNIVQRPTALNGEVVIRPIMYVALSYDHRIIDGADAVKFLVRVRELIEDPARLMLEV